MTLSLCGVDSVSSGNGSGDGKLLSDSYVSSFDDRVRSWAVSFGSSSSLGFGTGAVKTWDDDSFFAGKD